MGYHYRTDGVGEMSELQVHRAKVVSIVPANELKEVDEQLSEIRSIRKLLRIRYQELTERRKEILAGLPKILRPRRGRPAGWRKHK